MPTIRGTQAIHQTMGVDKWVKPPSYSKIAAVTIVSAP